MVKKVSFIIALILSVVALSYQYFHTYSIKSKPDWNFSFETLEGSSLFSYDDYLDETLEVGKQYTFRGQLSDTGAINMFYVYDFDGRKVRSTRYFLDDRIYQASVEKRDVWVDITGTLATKDHGVSGEVPEVLVSATYKEVAFPAAVQVEAVCTRVRLALEDFDLNKYKTTNRYDKLPKTFISS